ncbi:hypothetical protein KC360_g3634 [Hortaea werneckii]|nr:hypothetical protein KC325_g3535 [Hortaea werneckii]KAI6997235.1 hypothetical protein KC359_g3082 [Hortaea werneckii]KAI7146974.1 hypothetical protein KC344_g3188 [Hortaea werneckii]KAI7175476.1 hypothetical protein KC360_g3634 [Hortaea werneckii]
MPFKVGNLRRKPSRALVGDDEPETGRSNQQPAKPPNRSQTAPWPDKSQRNSTSRKQAISDFFRKTSHHLRTQTANFTASTQGAAARLPRAQRKTKTPPKPSEQHAASKRQSRQIQALDIDDEVLDKLMGPRNENESRSGIQSSAFLLKQRMRASSRDNLRDVVTASSGGTGSPVEGNDQLLSEEEVVDMFVGAPFFRIEEQGHGVNRSQVVFRGGNVEHSKRYATDHQHLGHEAFEACTMGVRRARESEEDIMGHGNTRTAGNGRNWGLFPMEVPTMLSAQGLVPGTTSFEHFLQLPVADSKVHGEQSADFLAKRVLLEEDPEQLGLREIDLEHIIDRLTELDTINLDRRREADTWNRAKVEEMGEDLFAHFLDSELGTTDAGTGSVTLRTQIEALTKVLVQEGLWWDFSLVEWRIKLGLLLWADAPQDPYELPRNRDVLLLQAMLAAELLIRLSDLELASDNTEDDKDAFSTFRQRLPRKVQYDLLLGRIFLENVSISLKPVESNKANRLSSFSAITFLTAKESQGDTEPEFEPFIQPKHPEQQLGGLLDFAEKLGWPHTEHIQGQLSAKLSPAQRNGVRGAKQTHLAPSDPNASRPISGFSAYATPLSSPIRPGFTPGTHLDVDGTSYVGGLPSPQQTPEKRPQVERRGTSASLQLFAARDIAETEPPVDAFEVGGWLSRSWLSGLVFPGEAASHFLISTLLENSRPAIDALGDEADLYGGFVYQARSYWSTSSVVGRVLGAVKDSKEVMGWTSISVVPQNQEEGWMAVHVAKPHDPSPTGQARIKDPAAVAADSDPLHGRGARDVRADDFKTPLDGPLVMGNEVRFLGMSLKKRSNSHSEAAENCDQIAVLSFNSPINKSLPRLEVELKYDVHFVTAYPCHPEPKPQRQSTTALKPTFSGTSDHTMLSPASRPTAWRNSDQTMLSPTSGRTPLLSKRTSSTPSTTRTRTLSAPSVPAADSVRASTQTSSPVTLSPRHMGKELPPPPAHPLHMDFRYTVIPAASLLTASPSQPLLSSVVAKANGHRPRAMTSPSRKPDQRDSAAGRSAQTEDEVVVLDCRGTEDLDLLARTWCAKVGEDAVVGKTGLTCLSCCIREAKALGIGVVIRI